jgi:putative ABC transport system permease protein
MQQYKGEIYRSRAVREDLSLQPLGNIHLHSDLLHELKPSANPTFITYLLLIAFFILFIGWVNYVNLTTAMAADRAQEVGVRKVLGATQGSLVRQFLTESFLLNLMAAWVAVMLVQLAQPHLSGFTGKDISVLLWREPWFWGTLASLVAVGGLASGLYPAFVLSAFQPVRVLKGKPVSQGAGLGLRKSLVVFQFAASVLLLAGTFTVYRQVGFMRAQDLGINLSQILMVKAPSVAAAGYEQKAQVFKNRVLQLPGVSEVSETGFVPGKPITWTSGIVKRLGVEDYRENTFFVMAADYGFLGTFGIDLVAGRYFSPAHPSDDSTALVLNEKAVRQLGFRKAEEAIGQQVQTDVYPSGKGTVVGVIQDYHHLSLQHAHRPQLIFFRPATREYFSLKIQPAAAAATVSEVKDIYLSLFPGNPFQSFFLDDFFDRQYQGDRRFGQIFLLFSGAAIFLACLGLVGLVAFATAQRTKEIGVRKVLGASVSNILLLLSKDFMKLVLLANLVAWPLAWWGMREWLQNYAYRIDLNLGLFVLPSLLVLFIALLTVSFQSIKAALANPVKSLRSE